MSWSRDIDTCVSIVTPKRSFFQVISSIEVRRWRVFGKMVCLPSAILVRCSFPVRKGFRRMSGSGMWLKEIKRQSQRKAF
jgi:hypothetical protein